MQKPLISDRAVTAVDLFSGIGGVKAGWVASRLVRPVGGIELDVSNPWLSGAFKFVQDRNFKQYGSELTLETVERAAEYRYSMLPDNIFWGHASFVCSNFSLANSNGKETEKDIRQAEAGAKFFAYKLPKVITIEQVPRWEHSESFQVVRKVLQDLGYLFYYENVDFYDYGLPQRRKRFFLVGAAPGVTLWRLPPKQPRTGWMDAIAPIVHQLRSSKLISAQERALDAYLCKHAATDLLIERTNVRGATAKLVEGSEPCWTLTRMLFTDHEGRNRSKFLDASIDGNLYALNLEAIRRLCGFPTWFDYDDEPRVSGVGFGYAVPPSFIRLLAETNLS
jgi:DNA (cytosine-5)-methyltransferase 1